MTVLVLGFQKSDIGVALIRNIICEKIWLFSINSGLGDMSEILKIAIFQSLLNISTL